MVLYLYELRILYLPEMLCRLFRDIYTKEYAVDLVDNTLTRSISKQAGEYTNAKIFVIGINARAKRPPATLCVAIRAGIRNL
jgi:hypothetical protein